MASADKRHEFRVVVDGVELSAETQSRVNAAIQKAAMAELAGLDFGGDFRFRFPGGPIRPLWWGIWIERVLPEQLERGGIETPQEFGG